MRVLMVICMILFLCLLSSPVHAVQQGNAVFFDPPYGPSACYGNRNDGNMVAGVSDRLWNNGRACGRRYRVRCIRGANEAPHPCKNGKTVVVKVVDYCKSGCQGIINLSRDAFSTIADPDAGIVRVELDQV
ncbi:plant natriuretic peptide A [Hibiscus trionum]|uniref:Plant natriuretic peptide A n=1 Tax=Hibiscus trionum TaxID=183268 RepID=A0A9W7LZ41_HIBTR|nr:plant natriuretic peptide A [Hibiscus trionum]